MSNTLASTAHNAAQKFSIDDAVGIIEVVISLIKDCQEKRNASPEQIRQNIADGRLATRIALRRKFQERGFSFRESRDLTDEAISEAQTQPQLITEALELADETL